MTSSAGWRLRALGGGLERKSDENARTQAASWPRPCRSPMKRADGVRDSDQVLPRERVRCCSSVTQDITRLGPRIRWLRATRSLAARLWQPLPASASKLDEVATRQSKLLRGARAVEAETQIAEGVDDEAGIVRPQLAKCSGAPQGRLAGFGDEKQPFDGGKRAKLERTALCRQAQVSKPVDVDDLASHSMSFDLEMWRG